MYRCVDARRYHPVLEGIKPEPRYEAHNQGPSAEDAMNAPSQETC